MAGENVSSQVRRYGSEIAALYAAGPSPFGLTYYVDKATGSNSNTGLTPAEPFLTIVAAITASNLTAGSYNMNTIYVNANTYSEAITTLPKNCNVIGVGAKVRIALVMTIGPGVFNSHFWNIQFRQATAAPTVTIPNACAGIGFHGCTFDNTGGSSATYGIQTNGTQQDFTIENCRFVGNPIFPTAIHITGNCQRAMIKNNLICATTNGILLATTVVGGSYGNYIIGNIIGRRMQDPNSADQMTYGIRSARTDGHSGFMIVNNRIEAADAISLAHAGGSQNEDICIANRIGEDGTAAWEDD